MGSAFCLFAFDSAKSFCLTFDVGGDCFEGRSQVRDLRGQARKGACLCLVAPMFLDDGA